MGVRKLHRPFQTLVTRRSGATEHLSWCWASARARRLPESTPPNNKTIQQILADDESATCRDVVPPDRQRFRFWEMYKHDRQLRDQDGDGLLKHRAPGIGV
jgi:hypothetical protein